MECNSKRVLKEEPAWMVLGYERKRNQAVGRFSAEVGRRSGRRSRASWLGLVKDLGQLSIGPAAMFYLVPTQCFKLFLKIYCQYLKTSRFSFKPQISSFSFKSLKLCLHQVSLPLWTSRWKLSSLCSWWEGHVPCLLQALAS